MSLQYITESQFRVISQVIALGDKECNYSKFTDTFSRGFYTNCVTHCMLGVFTIVTFRYSRFPLKWYVELVRA